MNTGEFIDDLLRGIEDYELSVEELNAMGEAAGVSSEAYRDYADKVVMWKDELVYLIDTYLEERIREIIAEMARG